MSETLDLRPVIPAAIVALTGLVTLLAQAFTPKGQRAPSAALSLAGLVGRARLGVAARAGADARRRAGGRAHGRRLRRSSCRP